MRYVLATVSLFLTIASSTYGANITDARVSLDNKTLEIDVNYGGGCKEHEFELDINECLESSPVQCTAELLHNTNGDLCEAIIGKTLIFSFEELGLNNSYYSNGTLTITGNQKSSVTVTMPEF